MQIQDYNTWKKKGMLLLAKVETWVFTTTCHKMNLSLLICEHDSSYIWRKQSKIIALLEAKTENKSMGKTHTKLAEWLKW
jgi:hypothetical protein